MSEKIVVHPYLNASNGEMGTLTVVIMARIQPTLTGGIAQAIMGMVAALGRLTDGDEQYIVVTDAIAPHWLDAHAGPNTRIVVAHAAAYEPPLWRGRARRVLKPVMPTLRVVRRRARDVASRVRRAQWSVPPPDPFLESLGADVVHFPYQWLRLTSAPSIFNPWDLQHIHHPRFFSPRERIARQSLYPLWCRASTVVEVASWATKDDLVTHLDVAADKIVVVPRAAATELANPLDGSMLAHVSRLYDLPERFILYPAQTWPHKNHLRLFDALALLRDRHGMTLPLVCTGRQNDHWPALRRGLRRRRLAGQVYFLGFVPPDHVRALYHLAEFTVFPSLFEGAGLPIMEAFREDCPLACSDIPVLVEHAGDAAVYFDPTSAEDIARALLRMHQDATLRAFLRERGREHLRYYSWDRTARTYRALYRRAANRPLTEEDVSLLQQASGEPAHRAASNAPGDAPVAERVTLHG